MENQNHDSAKKLKMIEKVRKLLDKTVENGCSEEEMETSLKMAQRIMMQYNIDDNDVNIAFGDIGEVHVMHHFERGEPKYWYWELLGVLCKANACKNVKFWSKAYGSYYSIIGEKSDAQIVKMQFDSFMPVVRNLMKIRYKEYAKNTIKKFLESAKEEPLYNPAWEKLSNRDMIKYKVITDQKTFNESYILGFCKGLDEKLENDKKYWLRETNQTDLQKYGLIVVKKEELIADYYKINLPNVKPRKSKEMDFIGEAFAIGIQDGNEKNGNLQLNS